MKAKLLSSVAFATLLLGATSASAHDPVLHVAQNTELRQFTGNVLAPATDEQGTVPLWQNLLSHHFPASTDSAEAQAYIDQAIMLTFGFNHAEAARSFRRAQELDPNCAICFWGEAFVLGPNINAPMEPDANAPALAALARANALAAGASDRERALIAALDTRYSAENDRPALDASFARAMANVSAEFPDDDDIAVFYAEALMDLTPWDYWAEDNEAPKGHTADIVATLERVLSRSPDHVGAIHLYIHAVEASTTPERAEPHADRLAAMDLGAGHLVHMPSHIYYRIGRYADSLEVNRRAVETDEAFFAQVAPEGIYAGGYYPHNIHFLMVSAQMAGDGPTAIEAAEKLSLAISDDVARAAPAFVQPIKAAPLYAHAQFSNPDVILAVERPSGDFPFVHAAWHYMRGVGQAAAGNIAEAEAELSRLVAIAASADLSEHEAGGVPASDILAIAERVLQARIAQANGDWHVAVEAFAAAKAIEDRLPYMEPRHWYYPVGQSLGAALLQVGDLDAAERAFQQSLDLAPNNGWSLFGLSEVFSARGDDAMIATTRQRLSDAWVGDDALLRLDRL